MNYKELKCRPHIRAAASIIKTFDNPGGFINMLMGGSPPALIVQMFGHRQNAAMISSALIGVENITGTDHHTVLALAEAQYKFSRMPDVKFFVSIFVAIVILNRDIEAGVDKTEAVNRAALFIQGVTGTHYGMYNGLKLNMPEAQAAGIFNALEDFLEEVQVKQAA